MPIGLVGLKVLIKRLFEKVYVKNGQRTARTSLALKPHEPTQRKSRTS